MASLRFNQLVCCEICLSIVPRMYIVQAVGINVNLYWNEIPVKACVRWTFLRGVAIDTDVSAHKKKMPVIRIAKENWMDDVECGAPSACIQFDSVHTNMVRESSHGAAPTTINWNDMESAYRKNAVIAFSCNVNFGLEKKKKYDQNTLLSHIISTSTQYICWSMHRRTIVSHAPDACGYYLPTGGFHLLALLSLISIRMEYFVGSLHQPSRERLL